MKKAFIYFNLLTPLVGFAQEDIIIDKSLNKDDIIVDKTVYQEKDIVAKAYKNTKSLTEKALSSKQPIIKQLSDNKINEKPIVQSFPIVSKTEIKDIISNSSNSNEEQIYMLHINKQWSFVSILINKEDKILIPREYMSDEFVSAIKPINLSKIETDGYFEIDKKSITSKNDDEFILHVNFPVEIFKEQKFEVEGVTNEIGKPISAFYGRYETNLSNSGLKNSLSLLRTTYVSENNWAIKNDVLFRNDQTVLLNLQWKKFNQDKTAIYIGDVVSEALTGTNSLNLFGIRYSTQYFNNNSFIQDSLPIIPISGYAVNPTKLDLYIDNQLVQREEISTGKYNLNIPTRNNGYGVAKAYIYDVLGNPTIVDVPFYSTNNIIKKGNTEYDVSMGIIRKDIGNKSFSYGVPVAQGLFKFGLANNYTQDLFVQTSSLYSSIGVLGHVVPHPSVGSIKMGITTNSYNQKLFRLGYDRNSSRISIGADVQKSNEFCSGYEDKGCIKSQLQVYANHNVSKEIGNLGFNYVNRETTRSKNNIMSLQWNKNITQNLSMTANFSKIISESGSERKDDKSFYIGLNYSLGNGFYSFTHLENNNYQQTINFNEGLDSNWGNGSYTFNSRNGQNSSNLYYKNNTGILDYQINYLKDNRSSYGNVNLAGGFAYIPEGNVFTLTRPTNNGIIYVDVENTTSPIKVIHQNKVYGTTNKNGKLIISDAIPFNSENIEIDLDSLPNNITLERTQTKVQIPAAGVTKIKFSTKPMPYDINIKNVKEGTIFKMDDNSYVVGIDGETSVDKAGTITFNYEGKSCTLEINPEQREYICEYK